MEKWPEKRLVASSDELVASICHQAGGIKALVASILEPFSNIDSTSRLYSAGGIVWSMAPATSKVVNCSAQGGALHPQVVGPATCLVSNIACGGRLLYPGVGYRRRRLYSTSMWLVSEGGRGGGAWLTSKGRRASNGVRYEARTPFDMRPIPHSI